VIVLNDWLHRGCLTGDTPPGAWMTMGVYVGGELAWVVLANQALPNGSPDG
jgi:hypothetical protein